MGVAAGLGCLQTNCLYLYYYKTLPPSLYCPSSRETFSTINRGAFRRREGVQGHSGRIY